MSKGVSGIRQRMEGVHLYCFSPGPFLGERDPVAVVAAQIRGGADLIQLREKEMNRKDRLMLGIKLRELTRREGVLFIVNDDLDLALILDADGVHLGQEDIPIRFARPLMKDRIIGVSTHNMEQVDEAVASGADYIGIGPVFETLTKADTEPLIGLALLERLRDRCPVPYVAIGGISRKNIASVTATGCRRVAVISDILMADDIEDRCRTIRGYLS